MVDFPKVFPKLGAILFNVYANDLVNIAGNLSYILYTVDTSIFLSGFSSDKIITKGNTVLTALHE